VEDFRSALKNIAGVIPQILQLQVQVTLASLVRCHKSGNCAKWCVRTSVGFNSGIGGGVSIRLQSRD
jgi:hypothetical protein